MGGGDDCDPADRTPTTCLVAGRGALEHSPARVAPLDIVRGAGQTERCLRNNVKDGTPRRAPEVGGLCMVTSVLFMHPVKPLWNPLSRVAAAATCLALDSGFHSGYA